ncbi:MAG: hypothetical protein HZC25_05570 [Rhodospirillales bacterium]|nr:hypothetical protein [Rhodospirillales bacterium]
MTTLKDKTYDYLRTPEGIEPTFYRKGHLRPYHRHRLHPDRQGAEGLGGAPGSGR